MRRECGVVLIDLMDQQLRGVLARHQDVELQRAGLVLERTGTMRRQERQQLIPLLGGDLDGGEDCELGHDEFSFGL